MVSDNIPVKWWIGPPAPKAFTIFTRLLGLSTFILISVFFSNESLTISQGVQKTDLDSYACPKKL